MAGLGPAIHEKPKDMDPGAKSGMTD